MASPFSGGGGGGYTWNPIYGGRVKPIAAPTTPTGPSLNAVYPNLTGTNTAASDALMNELHGQLSPETLANIRNAAASYGITSGMGPGSGIARSRGLRDIGLTTEQLQRQGLQDYSSLIPTVSATQTLNPAQAANLQAGNNQLTTEVNSFNATNAAAPNPADAQTYAQQLYRKYLDEMNSPGGGTGQPWWQKTQPPGTTTSNFGTQDWVLNNRYF